MRRCVCIFVVILLILGTGIQSFRRVRSEAVTLTVPDDFSTIQEAINNAADGDTVFVKTGTYFEHVVVNKTVSLVGENRDTTIIDGGWIGVVVNVTRNGVSISGFTVQRSGTELWSGIGIYIGSVNNCDISMNKLIDNNAGILLGSHGTNVSFKANVIKNNNVGIVLQAYANGNKIIGNEITESNWISVSFQWQDDYNTISDNVISATGLTDEDFSAAVFIDNSQNNLLVRNHIVNSSIGLYLPRSSGNRIYHNSILNNTQQANATNYYGPHPPQANYWDDSYSSGGNYWSDYIGTDFYAGPYQNETGSDGMGDTPYIIDQSNTDNYPLMDPWNPNAGNWTVVDDDGPADFSTIQEAINAASDGDSIFVKAGTYSEHVVVNKTVSLLGEDVSATIIDADGTGNCLTIIGDGVNVIGLTLRNSGRILGDAGIYLDEAGACNISGNHITDNFAGVWLEDSSGNFIMKNDIVANVDDGIVFNHAHNNTVSGNYVALHEYFGFVLNWSHNNTLSGNNVTQTLGSSHGDGINLWRSEHNHIYQNHVVANTRFGIRLEVQSNYNILSDNLIRNCSTGLQVYDSANYNYIYENSVAQCSDGVDINQYSTQNILSNNTITDNAVTGIQIYRAQNNQIESNHLANNWGGIGVHGQSHHNYIRGNNMENCTNGVIFHDSDYNEICRNNITECEIAIHFEWLTNFNTIEENDIVNNDCGVQLEQTSGNSFYHNNMMANTLHVSIIGYAFDTWDDGYPSGGNYWSDYAGLDQFSGPYQNVTGIDEIGDTPLVLDGNNSDHYPLMKPWSEAPSLMGDVNADGKVDMKDVGYVSRRFMCVPGDPLWDVSADFNGDGKINMVDIGTVARHFGESVP